MGKIKVLIIDDSAFFCMATMRGLGKCTDIEPIGYACDAFEAKDKILALKPDVLTLDVNMPRVNGLDFLDVLMRERPMPVVVVSGADGVVFEAIKRGAVDFVAKSSLAGFIDDLAGKIRIASKANRVKTPLARPLMSAPAAQQIQRQSPDMSTTTSTRLIAIGASTGGTEATSNILKAMSEMTRKDWPGMVITQHMPPVFTKMYAERLNRETRFEVKEARTGDLVMPNRVFIAPGDAHMTVVKSGNSLMVRCVAGEKVSGHCPSVDVLFSSVAKAVGGQCVGVILTGMGADGANGLLEMHKAGAYTVGQNAATCVVYGMPMEAYNRGAVSTQASLWDIPGLLVRYLK